MNHQGMETPLEEDVEQLGTRYQGDETESAEGQHSRASLGNWNEGLFDEIDMIPSVSRGEYMSDGGITVDDVVGVATAFQPFSTGSGRNATSGRKSLTPQKSGVRGSALRLMSCEKGPREDDHEIDEAPVTQQIQLDSAPRTRYTGILKKLEFCTHSGTHGKYMSTLQKVQETPSDQTIPEMSGRKTTSKRLLFSSLPHKVADRRVTFGGVSIETPSPVYEEDKEGDRDSGTHMSLSSLNAGSTPYSGNSSSSRMLNRQYEPVEDIITRDQLASALKKSLNFVDKPSAENASSFSFTGLQSNTEASPVSEEKTTPDFSFHSSGGKTRRLTPQSCSPSLLALYGKARRIATPELQYESDGENTPVVAMASPSSPRDPTQHEKVMPRRSPRLMAKNDGKNSSGLTLSPTEQGIRDSLKRANRRKSSPGTDDALKISNT